MALFYEQNMLNATGNRLGINSDKIIKKCDEYLRILQTKLSGRLGSLQVSDTCKVVVCLDLAAKAMGVQIDHAAAYVLSAVNRPSYRKIYHSIERLIGINKILTVSDLTVQLGCAEVSDFAQSLVERYVSSELPDHPSYMCAAVMAACKHRKIKVDRNTLRELCCIKAADLDKLCSKLLTIAVEIDAKRVTSRKRGHHLLDLVENKIKENDKKGKEVMDEEIKEEVEESYADWKKRILSEASIED